MNEILQIGVDARLGVDGFLLAGQKMKELHDTNRDGLIFLRLDHELPQLDVSDQLAAYCAVYVRALRQVPPVFACHRGIDVISKILKVNRK